MTEIIDVRNRQVHVRWQGQSMDVSFSTLDIGDLSDDQEIFNALAHHLETDATKFHGYTIDRHANGNVTVRPEAVFG